MDFRRILAAFFCGSSLLISACGQPLEGEDLSASLGPASNEPTYYGKPTDYSGSNPMRIKMSAKFRYRELSFNPSLSLKNSANGLSGVASTALAIPFAEFHIYNSAGVRIQQGETDTAGVALFEIPRTAGTYTLKVFSRALNDNLKVSVLEDTYYNQPYSISKSFSISSTQASDSSFGTSGTPYDLSGTPVYAEASESASAKIEGAAFNIMYDVLLANEYIRYAIDKDDPSDYDDVNSWWVADKVTIYWKAGFNPYSYEQEGTTTLLSYYKPGQQKLFILGGANGNVKTADTDHFDDSVILHEYGHFLEDVYGNSESPGGSHNGNFVIDPRLAWSEGWANYFQAAVRSYFDGTPSEGTIPGSAMYYYYVDTYGYKSSSSDNTAGISIAFNLKEDGTLATMDNTVSQGAGNGNFREVSIARTLYKATRLTTENYTTGKGGGGISFADVWETFAGEDKISHNRSNPLSSSLKNSSTYPIPNSALFNMLLYSNSAATKTNLDAIFSEERHLRNETQYAQRLTSNGSSCAKTMSGTYEEELGYPRSSQLRNNDFFLYLHNGASTTLGLEYYQSADSTDASAIMDLDLILYYSSYVYFEDYYWYAGYSSPYILKQSRNLAVSKGSVGSKITESISLAGVPAGLYMINVKINAYNKASTRVNGTVTYDLKIGSNYLCP